MWIDLIERKDQGKYPRYDIKPPERIKFELRTIIWQAKDCVFKDEIRKCNDLFVAGFPGHAKNLQESDTHWICRDIGNFNWRMKFPVFFPMRGEQDYGQDRFTLQVFDRAIVGSNTVIGEALIDLNTHSMIAK